MHTCNCPYLALILITTITNDIVSQLTNYSNSQLLEYKDITTLLDHQHKG